jgi:hypothetical protein
MSLTLSGSTRGNQIDLDGALGLPDGTRVSVTVETQRPQLTGEGRKAWVASICGVWANRPDIDSIFEEIAESRRNTVPRPVNFDLNDPS